MDITITIDMSHKATEENDHLYLLWTNADAITAEKMVFMYASNSLVRGWWDKVTLIIWGAPTQLVSENKTIQQRIKKAQAAGVHISACKACAEQLDIVKPLQDLGIELIYWGNPLTVLIKEKKTLLTV